VVIRTSNKPRHPRNGFDTDRVREENKTRARDGCPERQAKRAPIRWTRYALTP